MSDFRKIIFRSEHFTVVCSDAPTDTVVVTFSSMGFTSKGDEFWGGKLLESMGIAGIGFVSTKPNWFPPADMEAAIPAVAAHVAGRRVVVYGHSQGGYAAFKYGKRLGASMALSFSPQWSINPRDSSAFDDRFIHYYRPEIGNGERVEAGDPCDRSFIFVDRSQANDLAHVQRLEGFRGVTVVPVPFAGHDTVRLITEGGAGRDLMSLCVRPSLPGATDFRQLLRAARRLSQTYSGAKMDQLQKSLSRHWKFYERTVNALPEGDAKAMATLSGQLATGKLAEAAETLRAVTDEGLLKLDLLRYWKTFRAFGFDAGECRLAPMFKRRYPQAPEARLYGVNAMTQVGLNDLAAQELGELSEMPGIARYAQFFVEFYGRIDRLDAAIALLDRLLRQSELSIAERLRVGFNVVALLRSKGKGTEALKELLVLARLARGNAETMLAVTKIAFQLGSYGLAKDLVEELERLPNPPAICQVHALHLLARGDSIAARARVPSLLAQPCDDVAYWEKLSEITEGIGLPNASLEAAQKAFSASGETAATRRRLAQVLAANGQRRAALGHLKVLLEGPDAGTYYADRYARLAAECNDRPLAAKFAKNWAKSAPHDIPANILLCSTLAEAGDKAAAMDAMQAFLQRIRNGLVLDRAQFGKALDASRAIGGGVEVQLAQLALARFPKDPEFLGFSQVDALFLGGGAFSALPVAQPSNGLGAKLLARLGLKRQQSA